jgi:Lamin Tail Domain
VDAREFSGVAGDLLPLGSIDTTQLTPQNIQLLPHVGLTFELHTEAPLSAVFDLEKNGSVTLREPYPFVELEQTGTQTLFYLLNQGYRQKRPCRYPFATPLSALLKSAQVRIVNIEFNPPGADLAGEYALLQNEGDHPVHLDAWTLLDLALHEYTFPPFTLAPGRTVKVWTKAGVDDSENLYSGKRKAIWNNQGDTGILCDARGNEVGRYVYAV